MVNTYWILEATGSEKFPYRIRIKKSDQTLLLLKVQDRWPGPKGNIFCIREEDTKSSQPLEELERIPVVSINRYGKRLAVVLDRPIHKRCDFLFLKKKYKTKEGEYEQIFWRTQAALRQRRPKVKLITRGEPALHILIDKKERYPWNFKGCRLERQSLPVGDYALLTEDGITAVIERKTFENFVADFGNLAPLHQRLGEMEAYKYPAVVVEAMYADFLNPDKLKFYAPSFAAKVIAEIHVFHPKINIVFAGNRKLANQWALRFFSAIVSQKEDSLPKKVAEALAEYGSPPETKGGLYYRIKKKIQDDFPLEFGLTELEKSFPDASPVLIEKNLKSLKKEGLLMSSGRGKNKKWRMR